MDEILTLVDAAKIVGIAAATLRRYAEGTRLPQLKARLIGKTWITTPDDLEAWRLAYAAGLDSRTWMPEQTATEFHRGGFN